MGQDGWNRLGLQQQIGNGNNRQWISLISRVFGLCLEDHVSEATLKNSETCFTWKKKLIELQFTALLFKGKHFHLAKQSFLKASKLK